ncbi:unnamed protein product [Prunus armeniaca]|uniref:Uncharacterized protein n=1 Tax=Prunus armeniaca TaxID=36596 RepID=A0A6J5TSK2_PRUAR|nr:unnamed protein product [Prunus armeniaca]CAB4296797.1 unnamed protein product [Prunus armeniaca]
MSHDRSSVPRDLMNHQVLSPVTRSPLEFRSNSFDGRKHVHLEKNQDAMDFGSSLLRSSSGGFGALDGDTGAIDIFSASKQL